jgi:hypothetical protein
MYEGVSKSFGTESITKYNNKHSLRRNTKGYGGKTHQTDSQNNDTTASSGRELYRLQFSLQAASAETFVYTLVKEVNDHEDQRILQTRKESIWKICALNASTCFHLRKVLV